VHRNLLNKFIKATIQIHHHLQNIIFCTIIKKIKIYSIGIIFSVFEISASAHLGSISSKFYMRIFCTKVFFSSYVLAKKHFHMKNALVKCWWNWLQVGYVFETPAWPGIYIFSTCFSHFVKIWRFSFISKIPNSRIPHHFQWDDFLLKLKMSARFFLLPRLIAFNLTFMFHKNKIRLKPVSRLGTVENNLELGLFFIVRIIKFHKHQRKAKFCVIEKRNSIHQLGHLTSHIYKGHFK